VYYDKTHDTEHGPNLIFPLPADPRNGSYFTYVYDGLATSANYSVFGQVRWKIVDRLEFDAGVRYSHDNQTGDIENSFINQAAVSLVPLEPEGVHVAGNRNYVNFSPEATLTWTATPDTIIYGTYRTGYKPGESGNPYIVSAGLNSNTLFYSTEKVKGFELGFKSTLLDNTLRLTGAAFTYQYHDLQVSNFNSTAFVLTPLAGDMKTQGFEFGANWRPIKPLRVNASVAYTRAIWTRFDGVACYAVGNAGTLPRPDVEPNCDLSGTAATNPDFDTMNLTGLTKFRSPDWSGNLGFLYEFPALFANINVEFNGNVSFVSSYNSQENDSPFAQQPAYRLVDAGMKFSSQDDHLQFAIIGKNLTDRRYVESSYDQANASNSATVFGIVGRPRTVLFQATYKY
jgi:iron complex outermembrane receptor protein